MTLVRTLVWFVIAAVVMFGAVWLAERPGSITAEWHGWRLDTNVGVMLIVLIVLILLSVGSWLLYRWIVGAPGALFDTWGESRRRRGYQALTQGLAAVAAGDGAEAQKNARKAEALLAEPPLTLLLSAQAAQLTGDRDGAKRAFKLRPQTPWVVHSLFDMQAQIGRWREAQDTLDAGLRRKVVTADKGRTLKALLLVERSRAAERDGSDGDALALAREAFGLAPERIAVSSRLAELQIKTGDGRRAMRTLERGWTLAPHPDLAALYLKASGENDALKRVGIVRKLAAQKPDDLESNLALAHAALEAGLWGEARRYLDAAGGTHPPVRVCRLMAEVEERAQSDQAKVHEWLARAATAPADKAWRCSACGAQHEGWHSVCESCGAFGTLHWRAPGTYGHVLPPDLEPRPALTMNSGG